MDVHTQDQYTFIHNAILESVMCGDTQINASEFGAALHTLKSRTQSGETGFEHQFGVSCVSNAALMSTCYTCTQCGALFCAVSDTGKS